MGLTTLLAILGILVSATFGIWGVAYMIKSRYPGRITFVREQIIALFDSIVKNLDDLSISFKNKTIALLN